MQRALVFPLVYACLATMAAGAAAALPASTAGLPPFIQVTEHGGVRRDQFPVSGSIPLPQGALAVGALPRLALLTGERQPVPAQFTHTGRWPDGSVKWLFMDFLTNQDAGSSIRYGLRLGVQPSKGPGPLARLITGGVEVDTGRLRAVFGRESAEISLHRPGQAPLLAARGLVSRIGVRQRDGETAAVYTLPLAGATIETNGPLRAVVRVEGWHTAEGGERFSPSVIRLTFYRGQPFVQIEHTFVNSKNPDTHLITDISLTAPLTPAMTEAGFLVGDQPRTASLGGKRFAVFQENRLSPTYPPGREFEGRYRVISDTAVLAEGERYGGALVLRGKGLGVGVFCRNMWQMSPKSLAYDPGEKVLKIGLWPGEHAGDLDLMRTEVRRPAHYETFARTDPLYQDSRYPPTYVPHDLRHSAMGLSRTHQVVLWFDAEPSRLDPVELGRLFAPPVVPFVSGAWNVSTGVMGKQVVPGQYRGDVEAGNGRITAEIRHQVEQGGWYGMLRYGNVRYAYDKKTDDWMHYHPKYAWYNSGHLMGGGTMLQALWFQYLRSGDPLDYLLAEARGLNKADVSTVHYHEDRQLIGAMIRHGGFDPWAGSRNTYGAHAPLCGLPIQHAITGSERIRDVVHLIGRTNYRTRHFEHGRNMDTDIDTMTRHYEFTLDPRYLERAAEYVDHYHRTLDEATRELTYFEYRTTALRHFRDVCRDPQLRRKAEEVYLASYRMALERGRIPNLEMAAFAYEISRTPEAARQLEQAVEARARRLSGQLGWSDNMVLRGMNDVAAMNAVGYGLYWLHQLHRDEVEPVRVTPDGGTFAAPVRVALACPTVGAVIRYTLDGTEPTEQSPRYQVPFSLNQTATLRAKAFKRGMKPAPEIRATFAFGGPALPREGLELWFKADAGLSRDDAGVTRWADQSGHGRHAQAAPDRAPAVVPKRLGPLPVLRSDGRAAMSLRRLAPLPGDCTFVFAGSFTGNHAAVVGDGDDGWIGMRELPGREFGVRFSVGEDGVNMRLRQPYEPGRFAVWTVVREGGRVTLFRDGEPGTERRAYTSGGSTMNLGLLMGMRPMNGNLKGELAELLVFSRALPPDERRRVEGYLADRYGPSH